MNENKKICVIGDAFLDVVVPIKNLVVNGAVNSNIKISFGGIANVAVHLSRLRIETIFLGKVGRDAFGYAFKNDLRKEGIHGITKEDEINPTGICISLVDEKGKRSMITNRGANDYLTIEDFKDKIDCILSSDMLYFSGYSLISDRTKKSIEYLMRLANKKKIEVWFNVGALNIVSEEYLRIIEEYSNVLILNKEEAEAITHQKNIEEILESLSELTNLIVLTLADKGAIVFDGEEKIYTKAKKVKVVDTTGAGDAFAAGFLYSYIGGSDYKKCSEWGHKIASEIIRRYGAR